MAFWKGGVILLSIWEMRNYYIGQRPLTGGTILIGNFGRKLVCVLSFGQKLCWLLAGVSFSGLCYIQRAGRLDQVIFVGMAYR